VGIGGAVEVVAAIAALVLFWAVGFGDQEAAEAAHAFLEAAGLRQR
jgi:hypothetical protein